jgi:hypothetical protein
LLGLIKSLYNDWCYREIWNVGFVETSVQDLLTQSRLTNVAWLAAPRGHRFVADPFPLPGVSGTSLLVEDFEYVASRKAVISRVDFDGASRPARFCPVIKTASHLSYPFVFQENGDVYCIAESFEARGCDLYRLADSGTFVLVRRLLDDVAVVDPTVFRHAGRWWLFCTDQDSGQNVKLYAYHAVELESEWRPHALNPLKLRHQVGAPSGRSFRRRRSAVPAGAELFAHPWRSDRAEPGCRAVAGALRGGDHPSDRA